MAEELQVGKKQRLRVILQFILGISLGVLFLYLTFQGRSITDILHDISKAHLAWIILSLVFLYFTFYFRALRWHLMLKGANNHTGTKHVLNSLLIGYMVNSLTPRLGEIARCSALKRSDRIPLSQSIGTVVSERIIDMLVLLVGVFIIFLLEFEKLEKLFTGFYKGPLSDISLEMLIIGTVIAIATIILSLFLVKKYMPRNTFTLKVINFFKDMAQAGIQVFRFKEYKKFLFYTVLIWGTLIFMNYFYLKSLDSTEDLNLYFAVVVLFIGGIGWAMPTPGGIGTTHFVLLQLFLAFDLGEINGQNFGLISNGVTFIGTILFGLIAYVIFSVRTLKINSDQGKIKN
jgi:glycosyltransferase 2 family protein